MSVRERILAPAGMSVRERILAPAGVTSHQRLFSCSLLLIPYLDRRSSAFIGGFLLFDGAGFARRSGTNCASANLSRI
jgi:hypothetical protein